MALKALLIALCLALTACKENEPTIVYDDGEIDCVKEKCMNLAFNGKTYYPYYTEHCIDIDHEKINIK